MNNAGVATHDGKKGTSWENRDAWTKVFNTNVVGWVSLYPHQRHGLNEMLGSLIQGSERSARVRTGKTTKRPCLVTILPGAENLPLISMGGGSLIHRLRSLRKTAPLVCP